MLADFPTPCFHHRDHPPPTDVQCRIDEPEFDGFFLFLWTIQAKYNERIALGPDSESEHIDHLDALLFG